MGFPRTPFLTVAEDLPLYRQSRSYLCFWIYSGLALDSALILHGDAGSKVGGGLGDIVGHGELTVIHGLHHGLVIVLCEGVAPLGTCLLYTSPSPRDGLLSRMPSSA